MIRFLLRLILLAFILIVLLFLFAPNLLSTQGGKTLFFKIYKTLTGNNLKADKFEISWWKGQSFENITVEYPREKTTFSGQKITTDATLWQLLFCHNLGNMEMMAPTVIFNADITPPQPRKISQAGFIPSIQLAHIPTKKLPPYLGHIVIKDGKAQFLNRGFDPIQLEAINLDISLLKSQIKVQGNGETGAQGRFDLSLVYNPPQSQIDLTANLVNFPVRSIDQTVSMFQPSFRGALLNAVGDAVNVQLKVRNLPEVLELFCNATSPSFSAHIETQTQGGLVTLKAPAVVQFQIPPATLQSLASIPLQNPFQGQLKIDNLSLPLEDRESFSFQATLKGQALQFPFGTVQPFALFLSTDNFKARNFTLKIDSPQAQLQAALYLPNDWHRLTLKGEGLMPGNTHVDFSAETLSAISANVQGDQWQGSFWGGYDPQQKTIFLSKPAEITYMMAQLPSPLPPLLEKPLPLQIQVQPLRFSVANLNGQVSFNIRAQPTTIQGMTLGETILSVNGDLKTRPGTHQGTFTLTSTVDQGTVNASGSFTNPQEWTCKATLQQMPTSLIDLLVRHQLTPILGTSFDAKIDANIATQKNFSLDLKSPLLSAQGSLQQTDNTLQLTKPAKLNFTLTPEGYLALDEWINPTSTPFILTEPAHIQSTIASLKIPCCKEDLDLSQLICNANFSIDTLAFADKNTQKSTELHQVQLQLETPLSFKLTASGSPEGSISAQGSLDLNQGNLQLSSRLDQFSTDALDVVFRALGQGSISMATLFGPQVNLSASSSLKQWSGPVKLQLTSSNIRSSLDGTLTQGTLTLNDSFHMQMSLTPDLSKILLNWLNPLSLSSISSEAPLTIEIPAAGFSYPIHPFVDAKINIPNGRIELGKLYCHNEGNVNITLGLLKLSQVSDTLELWFAPLDFHVKNGVLDCERTEILIASAYQVCTWGTVDFVAREVDMILGLTASCLKKAFGIKNLPENYVLQIPMRGPFDNVKINTPKATTKIGALLLWQQKALSNAVGKGTAGAILGEFMNKLGPLPDGDSKAPPPKRPFPWENSEPAASKKKTSDASSKKKKLIVPDEQPIKQVLKLLK